VSEGGKARNHEARYRSSFGVVVTPDHLYRILQALDSDDPYLASTRRFLQERWNGLPPDERRRARHG